MVHAYKNTYYPSEFHQWHHERTGEAMGTTSASSNPQQQTMTPIDIGNTHFRDPSACLATAADTGSPNAH